MVPLMLCGKLGRSRNWARKKPKHLGNDSLGDVDMICYCKGFFVFHVAVAGLKATETNQAIKHKRAVIASVMTLDLSSAFDLY